MPKKLATNSITNELKGSAWFQHPVNPVEKAESPAPPKQTTPPEPAAKIVIQPIETQPEAKPAEPDLAGVIEISPSTQKRAYMHARIHANMHTYMHATINEKATDSFAFRYPPEVLEKLEDVLHEIKKQHRLKLTKNVVAVTAMAFLLADFEANGEESVLYQLLVEHPK